MTRHRISAEGLATARREDFTGYPADHDTEREVSIVGLPAAQLTNGRIRQGRVGFPAHAGGDGPARVILQDALDWASPRTRGWTDHAGNADPRSRGFPAHAGMDPSCRRPARR